MWSGPEAAGGAAATHPELRRGHVWLAQVAPERAQRAVLLLSRDRECAGDDPVLAAPVVRGAPARGRVAVELPAGSAGAVVDLRRLIAIDRSALIQPLARIAAPHLAEVDQALCDVLGLDVPAWPAADELQRRVDTLDALLGEEDDDAAAGADFASFAPPPAPPPPPAVESAATAGDDVSNGANVRSGLDDHPIAQLFGRPRPAMPQPAPHAAPLRSPAADLRAADVMPQLMAIVQRRLHRSAPRLEAVLSQAGEEGRTVEWAAAAVRHASVRGVMQSTLDEIATEIAAAGTAQVRRPS